MESADAVTVKKHGPEAAMRLKQHSWKCPEPSLRSQRERQSHSLWKSHVLPLHRMRLPWVMSHGKVCFEVKSPVSAHDQGPGLGCGFSPQAPHK